MARLEIELVGINKNLKQTLKESKTDLNAFAKYLTNIKPTGINALNTSLKNTKKILSEIARDAKKAADAINSINRVQNGQGTSFIPPGQDQAIDRARQSEARYREETQRLIAELNRLRLASAQNRQQSTAAAGSYREAQQQLTALGASIRNAAGGFNSTNPAIRQQITQYRTLNELLKAFDAQLGNHQRNVGNYRLALQGIQGYLATSFGFTALLAVGRKVITNNAEISDSLADVRRTAGLTAIEAENLSNALKAIDTRTALKDLLGIATIGGQLGISKDQLSGFTKAIDQLTVALGGELQGGAEGIAKSLGVLDNVFGITADNAGDVNKAYNQIGSAILGLGQSGLATGDFLADFGERVGGIAKQAGLSLPVILSYGAVLQESGVSAEVAGSAFKRLLSSLASNSAGFLKVAQIGNANLSLKEFNTIINTDTRKALDLFFQGLQKGGSSTVAFNTILKSLKISGSGVSQVIAALSQNQQDLNGHIKETTKDFKEATKATEQAALKNDNLAASLQKLDNFFVNATTNGRVSEFFKTIVDGLTLSLSEVNKLVNSSSWKEFFSRLGNNGGTLFELNKGINDTDRRTRDNQQFLFPLSNPNGAEAKLKQRGKAFTNNYLSNLKKTYEEAEKLAKDYENAVKNGTLKEDTKTVKEQKESAARAKDYYEYVLGLQKKLGFNIVKAPIVRSNQEAPNGLGKGSKGSKNPSFPNALPLLEGSELSGLDGVDAEIEKARLKYSEYYAELDAYAKKSGANRAKAESERAKAQIAEGKEIANIIISENQRVSDTIAKIREEAGIVAEQSRLKELQQNEAKYNELARQNVGQADVLNAIEEARLQQRLNINQKYDDKLIEDSQKLYDKINDLQEKAFTENVQGNARGRAKVKKQLDDRLADFQKHFDELRKLYKNDPIALVGINAVQLANKQNTTAKAKVAAESYKTQQTEAVRGAVESFGRDVTNTLRNLSTTADGTFKGIFSSLSKGLIDSLNDVNFSNFSKKISDALTSGTKANISGAEATALGLGFAGSVVSGTTKKSSSVGQGLGGALSGAGAGAAIGSAIPGLGTAAGAVIGGLIGGIGGLFGAGQAKKQEQLEAQQLAEQKRQTALLERANALAYASQIIGRQTTSGVINGVDINEFGQVITKVVGNDLWIINERVNKSRQRGK